jgi:hypothetical protein
MSAWRYILALEERTSREAVGRSRMSRSDDIIITRLALWALTVMILAAVPVAVWQGIDRFQHGNHVEAGIALLGVIGSILGVRHLGAPFRALLRELRREETVAQGQSMAPLARLQPEPVSESAIAAPIVIRLRADWRFIAYFIVITLAVFAFFAEVSRSAGGEDHWGSGFRLISLLFPFVAIGMFLVVWVRFLRQS